jgi:hypothetical protein
MDTTLKTLKASLEAIRDMATNALKQIGQSQEECSVRWKCVNYGNPPAYCQPSLF